MNNNNQHQPNKDNDARKIFTTLVLVLTLMIFTTGATYAYFAISATANNQLTGTAATASIIITNTTGGTTTQPPQQVAPSSTYQNGKMVPQISHNGTTNVLQLAVQGGIPDPENAPTTKVPCVDDNGNVICKIYTFVVKNLSDANVAVRGYVNFNYPDGSPFNNLRWKLMSSATSVNVTDKTASDAFSATTPIKPNTNKVYFDTANVKLTTSGTTQYKQYWLIVWIEETITSDQSATDYGTWYATVGFDAFDANNNAIGGLTSTITG